MTGPLLETARLLLRPPVAADFAGWAALMADEANSRYIGGPQVRPVAWRGFLSVVGAWSIQGFSMFSVIEKASGRWIGRIGPWLPEGWPGSEVVWAITRDVWGLGYAGEGATAAIDWAFDTLGWREVIHTIAPDNAASQQVARKLGSQRRGPGQLPEPFQSLQVDIWSQSREQWRARHR